LQLIRPESGHLRERLGALSATLLAATIAGHPDNAAAQAQDFGPGVRYFQFDSALLYYQEAGSRVQAIEPNLSFAEHGDAGQDNTFSFVYDAVSGATPNGAVPSDQTQTFVTPARAVGSTTTVTSASGGSTIIQLPPTPGQQAAAARQYTAGPNTLPVDRGFKDSREAFTFGLYAPVGSISGIGIGAGYSHERDYQAISANARIAQNFNDNNTTVSLSVDSEFDSSFPFGGVPTPLTPMSGQWKPVSSRGKTQFGAVLGLTQLLSRRWIMQLDYSVDMQSGYQSDPYRILSVVDPVSGEPNAYLYENRPGTRLTQSLFWDAKAEYGPTVSEISARAYEDSWGISSLTAEVSELVGVTRGFYVQPNVRWYHQSSANFFRNFLIDGQPLPTYASADTRLEQFTAITAGMKFGFRLTRGTQIYLRADYYRQTGNNHPADAIGQLKQQNLFAGTDAVIAFIGYSWDFR
jgi:Protein of unknown function (DUF3570)